MNNVPDKKLVKSSNKEDAGNKCNGHSERIKTTPSSKLSYSPMFPYSQQEDADNIDVMWDWYSPKSKPRICKQKLKVEQSPKLLVKRHPSNDQISVFNKLEEELKSLTKKTKSNENKSLINSKELNDFFNDSMEEELLMCSQQVEDSVKNIQENRIKVKLKSEVDSANQIENDSFDCMLAAIKDEDLNLEDQDKTTGVILKDESPIKCSPEEIEQKRLQALARLEAKKTQNIIEQNRQQALKRLELSRKRRIFH
ncbi:hypothetical protein RN001_000610 [Aquatica leii]|uniref:Uncharacterized protein n=1 Tax=Aquatica leii TaxID=1421715 RepID=A0AAN7SKP1_9COLE|nr:hypothetical protein RN001_000610 [Aquatica leii]